MILLVSNWVLCQPTTKPLSYMMHQIYRWTAHAAPISDAKFETFFYIGNCIYWFSLQSSFLWCFSKKAMNQFCRIIHKTGLILFTMSWDMSRHEKEWEVICTVIYNGVKYFVKLLLNYQNPLTIYKRFFFLYAKSDSLKI